MSEKEFPALSFCYVACHMTTDVTMGMALGGCDRHLII